MWIIDSTKYGLTCINPVLSPLDGPVSPGSPNSYYWYGSLHESLGSSGSLKVSLNESLIGASGKIRLEAIQAANTFPTAIIGIRIYKENTYTPIAYGSATFDLNGGIWTKQIDLFLTTGEQAGSALYYRQYVEYRTTSTVYPYNTTTPVLYWRSYATIQMIQGCPQYTQYLNNQVNPNFSSWSFEGQAIPNTDNCKVYSIAVCDNNIQKIYIYKNSSVLNNQITASDLMAYGEATATGLITLNARNSSGLSGTVQWNGNCVNSKDSLIFVDTLTPTTTTRTTTAAPIIVSTTTTSTAAATTTTTTILTESTALKDIETVFYVDNKISENITKRRGAGTFGTIAPGETSKTIIMALRLPNATAIGGTDKNGNPIEPKLGLISIGNLTFSSNMFGYSISKDLDPTIKPTGYFKSVNVNKDPNYAHNISVPINNKNTSYYVYLNMSLPTSYSIGGDTIRFSWFFDYQD